MGLVSFATHLSLPIGLTTDHARVSGALAGLTASDLTSLRDATFAGLALRESDSARTLLLVFSDGDDTSSWLTSPQVIDVAKRSDVVVYAVQVPPDLPVRLSYVKDPRSGRVDPTKTAAPLPPQVLSQLMPPHDEHQRFLQNIAGQTGGSVIQVKSNKDLTPAFVAILDEFRDRYVWSYVPAGVDGSGWHEIAVKAKGKSLKVTARRGYYAQ